MSRLALRRDIQTCFKRISLDEDRPREKVAIVTDEQIAARLSLTLRIFVAARHRGELPWPSSPRRDGDRYEFAVERAFRELPEERRRALEAASERDFPGGREDTDAKAAPGPKSSSGARGVTRIKKAWVARIFENGKIRTLGSFENVADASAAYEAALAQKLARKG